MQVIDYTVSTGRYIDKLEAKIEEYEEFIGQLPCQLPMTCRSEHLCIACELHEEDEDE